MAMNVERTMEFILQSQAKAEVRADRADGRLDRLEVQVKATANLVRQGMKIVQALAVDRRETRQELRLLTQEVRDLAKRHDELAKSQGDLAKAQARTESTLDRYLKSLSNGNKRNGP